MRMERGSREERSSWPERIRLEAEMDTGEKMKETIVWGLRGIEPKRKKKTHEEMKGKTLGKSTMVEEQRGWNWEQMPYQNPGEARRPLESSDQWSGLWDVGILMQIQEAAVCIFNKQKKTQGLSDRDRCKQRHTAHLPSIPPCARHLSCPIYMLFFFFFILGGNSLYAWIQST